MSLRVKEESLKRMNKDKLFHLGWLSFNNAVRLHEDSILLYGNGSYPSSYFLSVLASEEYGKMNIFEFLYANSYQSSDEFVYEVLKGIYSHHLKQIQFLGDVRTFLGGGMRIRRSLVDNLENLKQKAVYVGLPRRKGRIDFGGRILAPFDVSAKQAMKQITLLNDLMVEVALGVHAGYYSWDVLEVVGFSKKRFANRLLNRWPYSNRSAIRRFNKRYGVVGRRALA